jgi:hypothetical protein
MEWEVDSEVLALVALAARVGYLKSNEALSAQERLLLRLVKGETPNRNQVEGIRGDIQNGLDPLGNLYVASKTQSTRRHTGTFYTDPHLVQSMVTWTLSNEPDRIVDAGCGSGRFAAEVVRRRKDADVVAIDIDPVATLLCRANLTVLGGTNVQVLNADFLTAELPSIAGRTAFLGNPPYVRHHELGEGRKAWLQLAGLTLGHSLSKLSGLHTYFFFATALKARRGDVGCLVTSAEWLDTNYGEGARELFLNGLGLRALHVFSQDSAAFAGVMTSAVISCFDVGSHSGAVEYSLIRDVSELTSLGQGVQIATETLKDSHKWGQLVAGVSHSTGAGTVRLRDIVAVHRGAVTGANDFFLMSRREAEERGLQEFVRPVVSSAQEVFSSGGCVRAAKLRRVILVPPRDVDLESSACTPLREYLEYGQSIGVDKRYVCSHRRPWWHIGLRKAPPMIATYMARQAPAFATNPDGAFIVNVLHGLFPRAPLGQKQLSQIVLTLNSMRAEFAFAGRTYHGGLQKFEPGEMEELPVPATLSNGFA